jgi:hypothetical protein
MTMVALPLAFVPALGLLALRSFLKAHPQATSEGDIESLLRGLKFGSISAAGLPGLFIIRLVVLQLHYWKPQSPLLDLFGYQLLVISVVAGNSVNLFAIFETLHERGGASLLTAFFLILLQLCWLFTAIIALVSRDF